MPRTSDTIVQAARRVASCQRKISRLKRELAEAAGELRIARKQLRLLADAAAGPDPFDQAPPVRGLDS